LLFVCEFFIQHLLPPHATSLCYRFQYHRRVYVSSRDLHGFNSTATFCASQVLLHCNHCCIVNSICSYIVNSSRCYGITITPTSPFFTSQMLLHYNCSYIANSFIAWNLTFFLQLALFLIIVFLCFL
jgi:hypothetical protein